MAGSLLGGWGVGMMLALILAVALFSVSAYGWKKYQQWRLKVELRKSTEYGKLR